MTSLKRRTLFAAAATLPMAWAVRKPHAAMAALVPHLDASAPEGKALPPFAFKTADGEDKTLADYAGRAIVLNFWATWCVPCVAEMPALAALAGLVADAGVAVLPLSSDRGGASAVERFFGERGVKGLPVLLDPRGEAARAFGTQGIPTTILIDRHGRERGRVEGAADWASPEAVASVRALTV